MIRTLSIIAGAGFLVCFACFTAVAALGGVEVVRDGFFIPAVLERLEEGDRYEPNDTPRVEKTLPWTGAEALTIEVPAEVVYIQGPTPTVTVSGTPRLVDRVRVEGGRIFFSDEDGTHVSWGNRRRLTVTVTAPKVTRFEVNGSAGVEIRGYDQPTLTIEIAGSGEVEVVGRTTTLDLSISGSGEADLRSLAVTDASIAVAGSGDATVGATGAVEVAIAGSGDVTLTRPPAKLDSDIAGSGDLHVEN